MRSRLFGAEAAAHPARFVQLLPERQGTGRNQRDRAGSVRLVAMRSKSGPNTRAIRKLARALRREERTDEVAETMLVLLTTSAELTDLATANDPTNDTPIYARQKVVSAHGSLLAQLGEWVAPARVDSELDRFLHSILTPGAGSLDQDDDRL